MSFSRNLEMSLVMIAALEFCACGGGRGMAKLSPVTSPRGPVSEDLKSTGAMATRDSYFRVPEEKDNVDTLAGKILIGAAVVVGVAATAVLVPMIAMDKL